MGIVYFIGSGERSSTVDSKGVQILHSAKEPEIVFQACEGPNDEINNTGLPFPTGMTDSAADQAPKSQG